jgi:hypothetical protein
MSTDIRFSLGIVTENQNRVQKAEKLAAQLVDYLPNIHNFHLEKYDKFPNSYRIVLEGSLSNPDDQIHESIQIADSICSDWLVMYDRDQQSIELIFNKVDSSRFESDAFNVIRWAHFQVITH